MEEVDALVLVLLLLAYVGQHVSASALMSMYVKASV